jgi:hypothetical protein
MSKPDIVIGAWKFRHDFEDKYLCPRCKISLKERSLFSHMAVHDRREERRRDGEAARELGMGAKPLPGQLGLAGIGEDIPLAEEA